jgi:hypothetical protein
MSPDYFDDDGLPKVISMTFSPLVVPGKNITVHKVHWDLERGVGTGQGAAQDIDPEVMLSWSKDGGATFGGNRLLKLGQQGKRTGDIETFRLGRCKGHGFVFRLTCSANVARAIYQGVAEISVDG